MGRFLSYLATLIIGAFVGGLLAVFGPYFLLELYDEEYGMNFIAAANAPSPEEVSAYQEAGQLPSLPDEGVELLNVFHNQVDGFTRAQIRLDDAGLSWLGENGVPLEVYEPEATADLRRVSAAQQGRPYLVSSPNPSAVHAAICENGVVWRIHLWDGVRGMMANDGYQPGECVETETAS